jgi:hypothetical protein
VAPLKELCALPFDWGGQIHSGWLPKGAATPLPVPPEPDLLDVQILEESAGYLLVWTGRRTGRSGDTRHESLEQAEEAGWHHFEAR